MTVFVLYFSEWQLTNVAFLAQKDDLFPRIRHVCTAVLICISSAVCKFTFFILLVSFGIMFIPILNALCEARVPLHYSQSVYIQGWAESRHIMNPDIGRHKGATERAALNTELRQSIKLLCGFKAQKRHKHWPGHMHRHAQAAQWHGDTDTYTPTHTHQAHLVAAQGWWKRKGIDFHWLSLWGEK